MPYTILAHTADTGVEATAESFEELAAALGTGMFATMAPLDDCRPTRVDRITVTRTTPDDTVYELLSELLFRFEVDRVFFCSVMVQDRGDRRLEVEAAGVDADSVELAGPPIKAVTLHQFDVRQEPDGTWLGRVYFDV